jgi:hypothetical protein
MREFAIRLAYKVHNIQKLFRALSKSQTSCSALIGLKSGGELVGGLRQLEQIPINCLLA